MQTQALGIDVDVLDPETGASIKASGLPGEMVVRNPFLSMPACFWGDSENKLYRASYFERFDNVGCVGAA
jgi:acetoacetyl-CoA synthetase